MAKENSKLKVTLVKSAIGYNVQQKKTVEALGLRKLNSSVVVSDTPVIRGMINKVSHLLSVESVSE
ncbi:MAG: 50S ribosomal protein L30 [Anaerolineae bacterium]|nr:50S ribosomal protein L30 [Anaerolineae bacterium]MCA9891494.1 50S ribosomal protein L30 [Anaerolineae bacterium]